MTTRIIFLDFDGVLCTEKHKARLLEKGMSYRDECGMMLFDPSSVANLKRILNAMPDARLIMEYTENVIHHLDEWRMVWAERGLPGTLHDAVQTFFVKDLVDVFSPANIKVLEDYGKSCAIRAWLNQYAGPDCQYVILDDMADFRGKLYEHTVYINPWVGLTEFDAKEVILRLK